MTSTPTQYTRADRGSASWPDTPRAATRWGVPLLVACVVSVSLFASGAEEAASTGSSGADYASFRIITERNIFNPKRAAARTVREERAPAQVDSFALVGIMSYEKGDFAFFDGSSSHYRKVLSPGETIGGFVIKEITPTGVSLVSSNQQFSLAVNGQLQREDGGEWQSTERTEMSSRSSRSSSRSTSSGSGSDSSRTTSSESERSTEEAKASTNEEPSEVLRRLMEKREKELK